MLSSAVSHARGSALKSSVVFLVACVLTGAASLARSDDASAPSVISPLNCRPSSKARLYYPPPAIRLSLQGRVLVEFSVDKDGHAMKPAVVAAEPNQILPNSALDFVKNLQCKLPANWATGSGPERRFRWSFIFRLASGGVVDPQGAAIQQYMPSDSAIVVTGSLLR
jgi:TonB family protein